ncbi:MAG TPA: hypothetical protein DCG89_01015 [Spartobacteria bacterium]|nr:hypothetical protein [Spartobacteria bacterium]
MDVSAVKLCNTYFIFVASPRKQKSLSWLLLLYSLPTRQNTERVAVWRKLKQCGAVQIKTSTYLLPDLPAQYEHFQWLAKQIRDYGGDATLVRAQEIEGLPNAKLIQLFDTARAKEYGELSKDLRSLIARRRKIGEEAAATELARFTRAFRNIRAIDFFDSAHAHDVEILFQRAEGPHTETKARPKLDAKNFLGKTWLTRPRPEIDRVGSAWLIRAFIDPKAKFVFSSERTANSKWIPYDMVDAEFSHEGDDCTFETLTRRFDIQDKAVRKIGEMIHDADLEDAKFQRAECVGIDRVLKGWAKRGMSDADILVHGFRCFDGLYAFLQRL